MGKKKTTRGILLTANLPQLQNLIKRDPEGYREEFLQQLKHFSSIRRIFEIKPDDEDESKKFRDLIGFISQVSPSYPQETAQYPSQLSRLLLENYTVLNPETRRSLVHNLILLRNKGVISPLELLQTLFPLLPMTSHSTLRSTIRRTILTLLKTENQRSKNHKLNRAVQAMLFGMVERGIDGEVLGDKGKPRGVKNIGTGGVASSLDGKKTGDEAMWAVNLTTELWKKNVWNDAKTVSIVALACFHPVTKAQSAAIHFFLGSDDDLEADSEEEEERPNMKAALRKHTVTKKTASSQRRLEKTKKQAKKVWEKTRDKGANPNFPALQLLHDPQTFGERLYDSLNRYDKRFSLDHKLIIMQLLSRVMGAHKLCILGFYTYIIKYLTPSTSSIPIILACLAQSVHSLTPPSVLVTPVRKLASEFVHPGVDAAVHAAGLNAVREVCRRQIWVMAEGGDEDTLDFIADAKDPDDSLPTPGRREMRDLLEDLVEYKKSKDKGVMVAARGLLGLYREEMPELLRRRERGKVASMGMKHGSIRPLPFGHAPEVATGIEGLDLLEQQMEHRRSEVDGEVGSGDEDQWKDWEVETSDGSSASSSDSEEWMDVASNDDKDLEISDSDGDNHEKIKNGGTEGDGDNDAEPSNMELDTEVATKVTTLATTKILTPADFAAINELRLKVATQAVEDGGGTAAKRKLAALESSKKASASGVHGLDNVFVSEGEILGPRKKAKADYAERMESIQKGREGREKYGSSKGKRKAETGSSTTNKQKAKNKPLMMILQSGGVRSKKKASLRDKQKRLRAHIERAKKAR